MTALWNRHRLLMALCITAVSASMPLWGATDLEIDRFQAACSSPSDKASIYELFGLKRGPVDYTVNRMQYLVASLSERCRHELFEVASGLAKLMGLSR